MGVETRRLRSEPPLGRVVSAIGILQQLIFENRARSYNFERHVLVPETRSPDIRIVPYFGLVHFVDLGLWSKSGAD